MSGRAGGASAYICCLMMATAGCAQFNRQPAARPTESENTPRHEHVEVVADPASQQVQPAGYTETDLEAVQGWIEQVRRRDDVRARLEQPGADLTTSSASETPHYYAGPDAPDPTAGVSPSWEGRRATDSESAGGRREAPNGPDKPATEPVAAEAPRLGRISVRAEASAPTSAARELEPASVNAPAAASVPAQTLPELVEEWLAQPVDTSFRAQLDRRLLQVLAGKHEEAREPLELVSNEQQQMAHRIIETLIAIRDAHGGEPHAEANRVLAELAELSQSLLPLSELRISKLALTRAVRGFGRYEAFAPPRFPAGRQIEFVVYCQVTNFLSRLREDGRYESRFSMRTTVLSQPGDTVLELKDDHIVDECRAQRHDCFIPRLVRLPATLPPGEYVVKVTIIDRISEKVAEERTTFRLVARS